MFSKELFDWVILVMGFCLAYESLERFWYLLVTKGTNTRAYLAKEGIPNHKKVKMVLLHIQTWLEAIIFFLFASACFYFYSKIGISDIDRLYAVIVYCLSFVYFLHVIAHVTQNWFFDRPDESGKDGE